MAGLLPSKPDIDPNDEPRVVGLDSDDADELIDALSSDTTRRVLAALHEEPAAASELADRVDTSLQNVQYHLGKLEDAGLVEVGDTVYSEKGREMNVYVPADRALVVVAGREEETTGLKAALSRLLGGVGVLGVASVLVDRLARRGLPLGPGGVGGAESGDGGSQSGGGGDGGAGAGAGGDGGQPAPTPDTERAGDAGAGGGEGTATPAETEAEAATPAETELGTDVATEAPAATPTDAGGAGGAGVTGTPTPARDTPTAEPATALETVTPAPEPTAEVTGTPAPTPEPTGTPAADIATTAVETAAAAQPSLVGGLASSPGALFFLGGTTVLVGGFALWWLRQ